MKKVLIFLALLICLIVSEYFFLTELLNARRIGFLAPSFLATILIIYGLIRIFRDFISVKHTELQS